MIHNESPGSGSRWEPAPPPPGVAPEQQVPAGEQRPRGEETEASPGAAPSTASRPGNAAAGQPWAAAPARKSRPFGLRGRGALAGTAVALVSLGGLGGFALGQVTGGDDRTGPVGNALPIDGLGQFPGLQSGHGDGRDPDGGHGFSTQLDPDDTPSGSESSGSEPGDDEGSST